MRRSNTNTKSFKDTSKIVGKTVTYKKLKNHKYDFYIKLAENQERLGTIIEV